MLTDTHCHLNFDTFADDLDAVIERARQADVSTLIIPATDLDNCQAVIDIATRNDGVYCAVGVHPNSTATWRADHIDQLRAFAEHPKVVAIGEIGLDYYWDKSPIDCQKAAFLDQMNLAADLDLPVIIHNRDASEDVLAMVRQSDLNGKRLPGVMHSFSASKAIAMQALEMGLYLGFTGPITFKKAHGLRSLMAELPEDRILLETDAPFLSPEPRRGKRNEPANIPYIADRIAAIRGVSEGDIGRITTANAKRLFSIV